MIKKMVFIWILSIKLFGVQSLFIQEPKASPNFKKYNISVCAVFTNEAKYLKEWIEFHRLVGVDHFYLYNVASRDNYGAVLKEYIKEGIVSLIHWPNLCKDQGEQMWALGVQIPAYENAIKYKAASETKWLIFVDIDEFLLPINGNNLVEITEKYEKYPGVILPEIYFDASQSDTLPKRTLVVESVEVLIPPEINPVKTIEKVLFKPDQCSHFSWPPYHFVFKNGKEAVKLNQNDTLNRWDMRINRYLNRNVSLFERKKAKIPMRMEHELYEDELYQLIETGCDIEDHAVDRFVPYLKKLLAY